MNDGEQLVKMIFFPSEEDFLHASKAFKLERFVVVVLLSCPFANWLLDGFGDGLLLAFFFPF